MLAANTIRFFNTHRSCALWIISNFSNPHPSAAAALAG
jgi:hypothetical protein